MGRRVECRLCSFCGFCRLVDRVRLPHLLTGRGIQRDEAAAELAALIVGHRARRFFSRRYRDIEPPLIKHRRTSEAGDRKIIDMGLPEFFACGGIECPCVASSVSEERRVNGAVRGRDPANRHRAAHLRAGVHEPADAARGGIQRIHSAAGTADKHVASGIGWLGVGAEFAGIAESPFKFETGNLIGGEACGGGVLKARVGGIGRPSRSRLVRSAGF